VARGQGDMSVLPGTPFSGSAITSTGAAAENVRDNHQLQDRQSPRAHNPANVARPLAKSFPTSGEIRRELDEIRERFNKKITRQCKPRAPGLQLTLPASIAARSPPVGTTVSITIIDVAPIAATIAMSAPMVATIVASMAAPMVAVPRATIAESWRCYEH
jgi:hypothetical protein